MATTSTTTTVMEDSGISTGSGCALLRMSSIQSPTTNQPVVKMPPVTTPTTCTSSPLQDSGVCSELLQRLSLDASGSSNIDIRSFFEPDEDGDAQLHLAIVAGLADVVDALVRMSPSPEVLSLQNNRGYSPLHIAVLQNQPAFVQRLVMAGAQVNLRDEEGNTPLHLAARRGYTECAEAMMTRQSDQLLNQHNNVGHCSVHLATMGGHINFLRFLSWKGADMNALEGRSGRSSLHLAVGARNFDLLQFLVEPKPRGCGADPSLVDWYGRTPYHQAFLNGQSEMASYLASRTPNASDPWLDDVASDSEEELLTAARLVNSNA